jgi:hypothetical protein
MVIVESLTFGALNISMIVLKKLLIVVLAASLFAGCKRKDKPSLAGDEPVEIGDFIDFFQPLGLPCQFSDSVLNRKEKDSLLIGYKVFTQFVPDSIIIKTFGKNPKIKIYPLGKVEIPKAETYLFSKIISGDKKGVFVLSFDNKQQFIAGMPVLRPVQQSSGMQTVVMDKRHTITKTIMRKNADGSISEGKDVYVLNAGAKNFMLIMTDALDDKVTELINPIDTLPRKSKYSADYGPGKLNLVSVRDGRKADRITFFIHFEKNNGECTGELKGEAIMKSSTVAEYREDGDPCIIKFNFSTSSVTLTEESCGSRRGLKCLFDGSFARKKEVKPKPAKAKKSTG